MTDGKLFAMEFFTNVFTTAKWRGNIISWSNLCIFYSAFCLVSFIQTVNSEEIVKNSSETEKFCKISIEYKNKNGVYNSKTYKELGRYGLHSKVNHDVPLRGQLVHVKTMEEGSNLGCGKIDPSIIPSRGSWIALIQRGNCSFNEKIYYAAKVSNASGVVVYSHNEIENVKEIIIKTKGKYDVSNVISIYIQHGMGMDLVRNLEAGHRINMTIESTKEQPSSATTPATDPPLVASNTSVLFVSISFIVLIIISLAWLVFYYIQRCRYTNAKERLSRRLANAAKKAIAKIPQRPVKYGDKELDSDADQCAVCIEPYKISDVIRILPCKHVFHKSCVDPWLLDQRTCPMCKMDILRAFGMQLNWSQETVPQDPESGILNSSPAIEEAEHLSTSDEQGAVGGVKIVLYQHPAVHYGEGSSGQYHDLHYSDCGNGEFHDSEVSSDGSLHLCSSPVAQCHVECTSQIVVENALKDSMKHHAMDASSLARSVSLEDSLHISDDEDCNENHSLMTGIYKRDGISISSMSSKSLRRASGSSNSITNSIKQSDHDNLK